MIIHNGKKVNILQELRTCFLRLCKQAYSVFNKKGESLRLFLKEMGFSSPAKIRLMFALCLTMTVAPISAATAVAIAT